MLNACQSHVGLEGGRLIRRSRILDIFSLQVRGSTYMWNILYAELYGICVAVVVCTCSSRYVGCESPTSVRSEFVPRRAFDGHVIRANRHRRLFTSQLHN